MKRSRLVRFKQYQRSAQCPACLDRDALNMMGQPIFRNGTRLTAGCEICGGKGRVDLVERIDGWPKPDLWISYREDTPKRKAHRPPPQEPGPGVFIHYK